MSLCPHPPTTFWLSYTAILYHFLLLSLPFLVSLSIWTSFHSCCPPTPIFALFALPPLTCYPASISAPKFPWCVPISAASSPISLIPCFHPQRRYVPVDPCGFSLLGYILPSPWTQITSLPFWPWPMAWSLPVLRSFGSKFSVLLSYFPSLSLLTRSYSAPSLDGFWWFAIFNGFHLCTEESQGRLHSLVNSEPSLFSCDTWSCQRR